MIRMVFNCNTYFNDGCLKLYHFKFRPSRVPDAVLLSPSSNLIMRDYQRYHLSGAPSKPGPSNCGSRVSDFRNHPEPKDELPRPMNDEFDRDRDSTNSIVGGRSEHARHIDDNHYVTVYVLAYNLKMEQYTRNDVLHQVTIYVPPNSQVGEFEEMISKLLKELYPNYTSGYECRCVKQDVLRSALAITQMVNDKKLTPDEVTPGVILPLIGRVFVLLKGPHDPGNSFTGKGPTNNVPTPSNPLLEAAVVRPTIYHAPWSHAPPAPPPPNFYIYQAPPKKKKLGVPSVQSEAAALVVNELPRLQSSPKRPSVPKASGPPLKRKREDKGLGEAIRELIADSLTLKDSVGYTLNQQSQSQQSTSQQSQSQQSQSEQSHSEQSHSEQSQSQQSQSGQSQSGQSQSEQSQVARPQRTILRASRRFSALSASGMGRPSQQNNRSSQSRN